MKNNEYIIYNSVFYKSTIINKFPFISSVRFINHKVTRKVIQSMKRIVY